MARTVTTNGQGEYSTSELPLGTYNVTIEKEGFRTTTLTNIPVSVGSRARRRQADHRRGEGSD
jgi:hypothetical protein